MATAAIDKSPKAVENWLKKLHYSKPKTTKLHFFFHEIFGGDKQTAPVIAQANITAQSPTFFGMLRMFDNPLTVGPEPNSKQVGRAQGIHGCPSMTELALFFNFNIVFTDGPYNGSTLSVLGRVSESHEYRELQIIGGSGVFRLAQENLIIYVLQQIKRFHPRSSRRRLDKGVYGEWHRIKQKEKDEYITVPTQEKIKRKANHLMGTMKLRATMFDKETAHDHDSALAIPLGLMIC
ncbi:hypothetical protein HAX54_044771 [Datura stramonium]|uniref:Dirigent protein n=1 Tax=Datura stramonium TaxID=4076 RepID=A0ABS8SPJ3_DATST|nr:hypothetical protein [Datura stramonium]